MEQNDKINLDKINNPNTTKFYEDKNYDNVVPIWEWLLINMSIGLIISLPILGPVIGLIIINVLAFSDVNQNLKNWARATLIIIIISAVLMLIFTPYLFKEIMNYLFTKKK